MCVTVAVSAQHIMVKGVPVDGSLSQFVANMESVGGMKKESIEGNEAILKGEFAGVKDCTMRATESKAGTVCKVAILLPVQDEWESLEKDYELLKNWLPEHYGNPIWNTESFKESKADSDFSRIQALRLDACDYGTGFETDCGEVKLRMSHEDKNCYVAVLFYDKINQERAEEHEEVGE